MAKNNSGPSGHGPHSLGGFKGKGGRPSVGGHKKDGCCYAAAATKAVWAGKFRLAARYARLDVKARLAGTY